MCTLLFGWRVHAQAPLVLAANRDEFLERPTEPVQVWAQNHNVLAGRDLSAGGTWLGVTRTGRWAAITNVREPHNIRKDAPSRGALVADFLLGQDAPGDYLAGLVPTAQQYNGFNLLVGTMEELWYYGNRVEAPQQLPPGIYGLSNATLDVPWPKVISGKQWLAELLKAEALPAPEVLLEQLGNPRIYPDAQLPSTGVPMEWERGLSALCITLPNYGTRCSTVLYLRADGTLHLAEQVRKPQSFYTEVCAPMAR